MKCPGCGKQFEWEQNLFRPFCSERCKLVDLGKWVNEEYRVPGREVPTQDEDKETDDRINRTDN